MTQLNKYSSRITQVKSQGASQAMLYATGLTPEDMDKAQVGIASMWWEGNPCNMHLNDLASHVDKGVEDAGMVGMRFNTIGVSDGISMGTEGMKTSLISRDLIADSIELVARGNMFDGLIALSGCDKTIPGCVMALARLDIPGVQRALTAVAELRLELLVGHRARAFDVRALAERLQVPRGLVIEDDLRVGHRLERCPEAAVHQASAFRHHGDLPFLACEEGDDPARLAVLHRVQHDRLRSNNHRAPPGYCVVCV